MSDFTFYVLLPITIRIYVLHLIDWTIRSLLLIAPLVTMATLAIVMAFGRLTKAKRRDKI